MEALPAVLMEALAAIFVEALASDLPAEASA